MSQDILIFVVIKNVYMKRIMMLLFSVCLLGTIYCRSIESPHSELRWIGSKPQVTRPVSFGLPFAQGELKKGGAVSLFAADGKVLPTDTWTMAYWPDGSVKWAGIATVVNIQDDSLHFKVLDPKQAKKQQVACPIVVDETSSQWVVSTGKVIAYIPKNKGAHLLDSLNVKGTKVGGAARLLCTTQDHPNNAECSTIKYEDYQSVVETVVAERIGKVRATFRLDGKYINEKGRKWLPFTVRLHFYAGSEQIRMVHTFVYDGDMNSDFIHALGVQVEVPMREALYNRHVAFATADGGVWTEPVQPLSGRRVLALRGDNSWQVRQMRGERIPEKEQFDAKNQHLLNHWAAWNSFRLSQSVSEAFTIRKRAHVGHPWIGTFAGSRSPGYVFLGDVSGGLGVSMKDFWQSCPTALQVDDACAGTALLTAWMWSPDAPAMDLRHYDDEAHDLEASYEDVQEGMSTPYGIARTNTLTLVPQSTYDGKESVALMAQSLAEDAPLMCTPEYLHAKRAFGTWSLPDRSTPQRRRVEERLQDYLDYYVRMVEQHKWYGFWNYGDFMHTYDPIRHEWKYDVGGYAWDNTELGTNMWLWYSFLRTGRADVWRLAEAMSRHTAECDVYHIGPYAGLGSRHNVSHWGCGAKEARISQAAWNRFYYYLTTDERSGDLMSEVKDAEQMLYTIDPMRLALPRSLYPCTAPARLRVGPDWVAYAGNWMTEWERTGNKAYRDKIIVGMKSLATLPQGLFTGPGVLGFDPATGKISYEGDKNLQHTNHLLAIMGGFQVMDEMMTMIHVPAWEKVWLEHADEYKEKALTITRNPFPVTILIAYAAAQTGSKEKAGEAWKELWSTCNNNKPFEVRRLSVPEVPIVMSENPLVCTNDAAMWSLAAIYMQEVIPQ